MARTRDEAAIPAADAAWDVGAVYDAEADRFDVLATLLESYEEQHDPFPEADPVDILHFAIESMGRSQSDLARILGSRPRASEVLNRRRGLTIEMIHAISQEWHLPVALLAKPYPLRPPAPSAA